MTGQRHDSIIRAFSHFLGHNVSTIHLLRSEEEHLFDDWAQANWEMLVEKRLFREQDNFLNYYGDGARFEDISSRISNRDAVATHGVFIAGKDDQNLVDLTTSEPARKKVIIFDRFVFWDGTRSHYIAPFNAAIGLVGDDLAIFWLDNIVFEVHPLPFGVEEAAYAGSHT